MRTLAVFPTDPLQVYVKKGEVKPRYFNPENYFDKVIIINVAERELTTKELEWAQAMVGKAKLVVKTIKVPSTFYLLTHLCSLRKKIMLMLKELKPDAVRAFGCLFEGYFGSYCAKKLKIPFVISLHASYDELRQIFWRSNDYGRLLFYFFWYPFEMQILKSANYIIAVYSYAAQYALDHKYPKKNLQIIYNKVDENNFFPPKNIDAKYASWKAKAKKGMPLQVICVQRHVWYKNQKCLIRSMVGLQGKYKMLFIGDGPFLEPNRALAKSLGLEKSIEFIPNIDNKDIRKYYHEADIFATSLVTGGIGIPEIEAMACGVPIIHGKYPPEPNPEILPTVAFMVDNNPESYRELFLRLYKHPELLIKHSKIGLEYFKKIKGSLMEKEERKVYEKFF